MKLWILVLVAVLLLVVAVWSESFEPTASIQAPPYSAAEKVRIYGMANAADQAVLRAKLTAPTDPGAPEQAGALLTPVIGDFFTQVFRPATTPITLDRIDTFLASRPPSDIRDIERRVLKIYFVDQQGIGTAVSSGYADVLAGMGQGVGYLVNQGPTGPAPPSPIPRVPTGPVGGGVGVNERAAGAAGAASTPSGAGVAVPRDDSNDTATPICPAGSSFRRGQCRSDATPDNFTCPSGYTPSASRNCQNQTNPTDTLPPQCPSGKVFDDDRGGCVPVETRDPTCPSGYTIAFMSNVFSCRKSGVYPTGSSSGGAAAGGATQASPGASGATTTTPAISNGLFGPPFTAFGDPSPRNGVDSSRFTSYPQVLGGVGEPTTTLAGAGVTRRGMYAWDLELPSVDSLGSSEKSQYLPFSRTPGDREKIPDPFRVAQTFDLSSLSSKTEPVPFLTDFSAFQR
jgi:hypothetical protein